MIKKSGNASPKPCLRNAVHSIYARNSIGLSAVGKWVILVVLGLAACFAIACSSNDDKNVAGSGDAVNANGGANGGTDAISGSGAPSIMGNGGTSGIQTGAGVGGDGGTTNAGTTPDVGGKESTTGGTGGQGNTDTAGSTDTVDAGGIEGTAGNDGSVAGETVDGSNGSEGLGLLAADVIHGLDGTEGPYETAPEDLASGPGRTSGVFRPANLGANGEKHPVFIWSCGGGTNPRYYIEHLNHIASYGIVVIADAPPTPATGGAIIASMDWIIEQNETQGSPFYQKLETQKIGIGGHSMGSLNTFLAGSDPRVGTTVNVCGGSRGMQEPSRATEYRAPALYLGEVNEGGTLNFDIDYEATPTPVVFLIHESTNNNLNDHIMCARDNMAAWIAWIRWHLAGETKWKPDFFAGGIYCNSPWAECRSKNW